MRKLWDWLRQKKKKTDIKKCYWNFAKLKFNGILHALPRKKNISNISLGISLISNILNLNKRKEKKKSIRIYSFFWYYETRHNDPLLSKTCITI